MTDDTPTFACLGTWELKGRGTMYVVESDRTFPRSEPTHLNGKQVLIDGKPYLVKGFESFAKMEIRKGERISLLAIEAEQGQGERA